MDLLSRVEERSPISVCVTVSIIKSLLKINKIYGDNVLNKDEFALNLLEWYYNNKRDLPWRQTTDPYKIWLSEVMLQQTQVQTVIPYFNKFIDKYPTLDDLANADAQEVLKDWEGLGYYNRIRNLHSAVKEVQSIYDSIVPENQNHF